MVHYNSELQDIADQLLAAKDKRIKYGNIVLIATLIIVVVVVCVSLICIQNQQQKYEQLLTDYDSLYGDYEQEVCVMSMEEFVGDALLHPEELSKESLYTSAVLLCADYPDVLVAQACLESGMGTSNLGKRCNNLFGMRYTSNDPLAIGEYHGWAIYACWEHSLASRIIWDTRNNMPKCETAEEYMDQLYKKVYFTDPLYKTKLLTQIKVNNL